MLGRLAGEPPPDLVRLRRRRHQPAAEPCGWCWNCSDLGVPMLARAEHDRHRRAAAACRSIASGCRAELGVPVVDTDRGATDGGTEALLRAARRRWWRSTCRRAAANNWQPTTVDELRALQREARPHHRAAIGLHGRGRETLTARIDRVRAAPGRRACWCCVLLLFLVFQAVFSLGRSRRWS
ncbi:MAG: hypothetical protein MZV49_22765 [Rhodopseudomonas palustris]|nr:hypothetical protein [Rhodopseudomonas palustris]